MSHLSTDTGVLAKPFATSEGKKMIPELRDIVDEYLNVIEKNDFKTTYTWLPSKEATIDLLRTVKNSNPDTKKMDELREYFPEGFDNLLHDKSVTVEEWSNSFIPTTSYTELKRVRIYLSYKLADTFLIPNKWAGNFFDVVFRHNRFFTPKTTFRIIAGVRTIMTMTTFLAGLLYIAFPMMEQSNRDLNPAFFFTFLTILVISAVAGGFIAYPYVTKQGRVNLFPFVGLKMAKSMPYRRTIQEGIQNMRRYLKRYPSL